MTYAVELPTVPDSGLAKELFDLTVDFAADLEQSCHSSEERRRLLSRLFAIAKGVQVVEAGGTVMNALDMERTP